MENFYSILENAKILWGSYCHQLLFEFQGLFPFMFIFFLIYQISVYFFNFGKQPETEISLCFGMNEVLLTLDLGNKHIHGQTMADLY